MLTHAVDPLNGLRAEHSPFRNPHSPSSRPRMPSSAEEEEALLQKAPLPPVKNAQRLFRKSSKNLVKEDEPPNRTSTQPKNMSTIRKHLAQLRSAIRQFTYRAGDNAKQVWREDTQIVVVCGLSLLSLYGMSVSTLRWFHEQDMIVSWWARLMETTGFVNWPRVNDKSLLSSICVATPIFVSVVSTFAVPGSILTRRARGIKLFVYSLSLTAAASFLGLILSERGTPIDVDAVMSLSSQRLPVANFNRGFCHAWCRQSEFGVAALVRGDCGPDEHTIFDDVLGGFDMKDWCVEAIAQQNYELTASYHGVSPFASLKGPPGRALLTVMQSQAQVISIWSWSLFFWSSLMAMGGGTALRWYRIPWI